MWADWFYLGKCLDSSFDDIDVIGVVLYGSC